MAAGFSRPEKLAVHHRLEGFDCGEPVLDEWLVRFARANQAAGACTVFESAAGERVVGYYALAAGSVERSQAPRRVARGLADHPVPVMLLARLAVDRALQGRGLGRALLQDALRRILQAADTIGARAVLVHAKNRAAIDFYSRFDFEPSSVDPGPTDGPRQMFLLKDLRRAAVPDP